MESVVLLKDTKSKPFSVCLNFTFKRLLLSQSPIRVRWPPDDDSRKKENSGNETPQQEKEYSGNPSYSEPQSRRRDILPFHGSHFDYPGKFQQEVTAIK